MIVNIFNFIFKIIINVNVHIRIKLVPNKIQYELDF